MSFPPPTFFFLFFQSQSTSPSHQSFFSLMQLLCSQIRPQATKIWVSNTFSQQLCNPHVSSKSLQPRLAVSSEPPPSHPAVSSRRTTSSGVSGLRNKQGFWVYLGNLTCWCLAGCSPQMLQQVTAYPQFHLQTVALSSQPVVLLLRILTFVFKKRVFGIYLFTALKNLQRNG